MPQHLAKGFSLYVSLQSVGILCTICAMKIIMMPINALLGLIWLSWLAVGFGIQATSHYSELILLLLFFGLLPFCDKHYCLEIRMSAVVRPIGGQELL